MHTGCTIWHWSVEPSNSSRHCSKQCVWILKTWRDDDLLVRCLTAFKVCSHLLLQAKTSHSNRNLCDREFRVRFPRQILRNFKMATLICHSDQQKAAWFESFVYRFAIDIRQWLYFACETSLNVRQCDLTFNRVLRHVEFCVRRNISYAEFHIRFRFVNLWTSQFVINFRGGERDADSCCNCTFWCGCWTRFL